MNTTTTTKRETEKQRVSRYAAETAARSEATVAKRKAYRRTATERVAVIDGLELRVGDTMRFWDSYYEKWQYVQITAIT